MWSACCRHIRDVLSASNFKPVIPRGGIGVNGVDAEWLQKLSISVSTNVSDRRIEGSNQPACPRTPACPVLVVIEVTNCRVHRRKQPVLEVMKRGTHGSNQPDVQR